VTEAPTGSAPPARRQRLDPEIRRRQILDAAREAFTELGGTGTRMRDIAERAGITVPYLHRVVGTREELYREAVLQPLEELAQAIVEETHELATRSDITRAEVLHRFHTICLRHFVKLAPLLRAQLLPRKPGEPWFHTEVLFPRWWDAIAAVIADVTGWDAASVNLDVFVHALMGLYIEMAFESDLEKTPLDVDRVATQLVDMFAPRHGRAPTRDVEPRAKRPVRMAGSIDASSSSREDPASDAAQETTRVRLTKAERRAVFLVAATSLFLEVGFNGARSKDIADRAETTEGFLYQHFTSKEEMYELAIEIPTEQALIELVADIEHIADITDRVDFVSALNKRCLSFFVEHGPKLGTALLSDVERSRRFYRDRVIVHFEGVGSVIAARMGYDSGRIDPELARRAIMGSQWGASIALESRYQDVDLNEIAHQLTGFFTAGVKAASP
jgi:AcrR family transcriptional regulator